MRFFESNSKRSTICIMVIMALITLAPRVSSLHSHWTSSDEDQWIGRSFRFLTVLHRGDFHETLLTYHPGVVTMWVGAATLLPKYRDLLFMFDDKKKQKESEQTLSLISVDNLQRTRFGIVILTTVTILIVFCLIRKLLGLKIAIVASLLIAFDPTYLMETRKIHVDASMTSFLVLAILSLITYMEPPRKRGYLLFSGINLGLACLSKTPALILIFYLPLLFALYYGIQISNGNSYRERGTAELLCSLLVWTGAACLTFIGLWPALWVAKIKLGGITLPLLLIAIPSLMAITVWSYRQLAYLSSKNRSVEATSKRSQLRIMTLLSSAVICLVLIAVLMNTGRLLPEIRKALATPHGFPQMFLGNVVYKPGPLYYPIMITIYSTPLVLFSFVIGILVTWIKRNQIHNSKVLRVFLGLSIFVILYIVCMSLGAKKLSRYILPIYPILDILAAASLCALLKLIDQRFGSSSVNGRYNSFLSILKKVHVFALILPALLLYQIISTVSLHPHYGSYYNPLWSRQYIMKATVMGRGVGIEEAANYLNQIKSERDTVVRASVVGSDNLRHYFNGKTQSLDALLTDNTVDVYDFIYVHDMQLGTVNEELYANRIPEYTVRVNNIDFVKIYKVYDKF